MSNNSKNISDKINRYLNGKMETKEKAAFEQELDKNDSAQQKFMQVVALAFEKKRIENNIKELQKTHPAKRTKFYFLNSTWAKVAAVLIILLIPAGIMIKNYLVNDTLLNDHYLHYYSKTGFRNIQHQQTPDPVNKAFELYRSKQFNKAAPVFESLADTIKTPEEMYLYAGICNLQSGSKKEIKKAIYQLERILQSKNQYNEAARWFLAIALFENNEKENARVYFEQIASADTNYRYNDAREVLETRY